MLPDGQNAAATKGFPQRAAILLAAGDSTRLGQPKQLVEFEGQALLRRAAEAALASGASPVMVVLGRKAGILARNLEGLPVTVVTNENWQQGMGTSLGCGAAALQKEAPQAGAVLLMVCDQPLITANHLKMLWDRHADTGKVVAARHGGRPGVPAIFPAKYIPDLAGKTGDQGARSLLRGLPEGEIELVALPEAEFDLDTPQDLARMGQVGQNSL